MHIRERKNPSGKTVYQAQVVIINVRTGQKHRESKTLPTHKQAEAWAKELEARLSVGVHSDTRAADKMFLHEYIQEYIDEYLFVNGNPTKVGASKERTLLRKWLKHPFSERAISKLLPADFIKYVRERQQAISKRGTPVADQTIKHEIGSLSNVYQYIINVKGIPNLSNPVRGIPTDFRPGGSREVKVRILHDQWIELEKLMLNRRNKRYVLAAELGIETAMRQGEILRLEPQHVHIDKSLKTKFVQATDFRRKGGRIVAFVRDVPLTNRGVIILKEVLDLRKIDKSDNKTIWGVLSADGLSRAFREDCTTLDIRDDKGNPATFHATRHEACSRMAVHIPIHQLMKITGHVTISQLQRYYNPNVEDLGNLISVMNKRKPKAAQAKKPAAKKPTKITAH